MQSKELVWSSRPKGSINLEAERTNVIAKKNGGLGRSPRVAWEQNHAGHLKEEKTGQRKEVEPIIKNV